MVEIERKFLVTSTDFIKQAVKETRITQGYLSTDPARTVRVRIKGDTGFLTIKGKSNQSGTTRVEIEETITIEKAEALLSLCLPGVIDKTRYEIPQENHLWEVDVFYKDNQDLIIAEIELTSEDQSFYQPAWLGEEVTGQNKYYNSQLSVNPYKKW